MRQAFINILTELAETDKDLYLLTADMGFGLVEQFATRFPKQYINVGVAEQNMIGVATGLALEGKKVFCYSIGNFPTMRCLEQIRNDVCYHNLPVCIVSGGAGLWYGALGMTHWAVEDIAVMRCLPNMAVVSPCDAMEMVGSVRDIYRIGGPAYLRMTRCGINISYVPPFQFGNARQLTHRSKTGIAIIATGGLVETACSAALIYLFKQYAQVLSVPVIKPLDSQSIMDFVHKAKLVITIEEHSKIGGLGSAVAEVLAGLKHHSPLVRMGTEDRYPDTAMSYEELLVANHLDVDSIVKEAMDALLDKENI